MAVQTTDVIVLGTGHNGLVCANYLAAAGLSVTVLERRSVVGGAAVTEEFVPGFRNSSASYTVSLLHHTVIRDLRLYDRGLRIVEIVPGSPADRAGLRAGDLLVSAGGQAVTSAQALQRLMLGTAIGEPLALTVLRSDALVDVIATPIELTSADD